MGLRGGGKRGASTATRSGRKVDISKDEVIADMSLNLQRTLQSLSSCTNSTLTGILNRISQMKDMCENDAHIGRTLLQAFNTPQLQNLNLASGGGNKDYKTNLVRSYVFHDEMKNIAKIESEIDVVKEAMTEICRLILTTTFGNSKGEIGWSEIQEVIMNTVTMRARNEGAREAQTPTTAVGMAPPGLGTETIDGDATMRGS